MGRKRRSRCRRQGRFYGGTWLAVALRALVIGIVYLLFFSVAVAALVVAAVALR